MEDTVINLLSDVSVNTWLQIAFVIEKKILQLDQFNQAATKLMMSSTIQEILNSKTNTVNTEEPNIVSFIEKQLQGKVKVNCLGSALAALSISRANDVPCNFFATETHAWIEVDNCKIDVASNLKAAKSSNKTLSIYANPTVMDNFSLCMLILCNENALSDESVFNILHHYRHKLIHSWELSTIFLLGMEQSRIFPSLDIFTPFYFTPLQSNTHINVHVNTTTSDELKEEYCLTTPITTVIDHQHTYSIPFHHNLNHNFTTQNTDTDESLSVVGGGDSFILPPHIEDATCTIKYANSIDNHIKVDTYLSEISSLKTNDPLLTSIPIQLTGHGQCRQQNTLGTEYLSSNIQVTICLILYYIKYNSNVLQAIKYMRHFLSIIRNMLVQYDVNNDIWEMKEGSVMHICEEFEKQYNIENFQKVAKEYVLGVSFDLTNSMYEAWVEETCLLMQEFSTPLYFSKMSKQFPTLTKKRRRLAL